jgi:hypothetical protein
MRHAVVSLLGALSLTGCATLQAGDVASAERALTAAGFEARPADTPEKLAHLESLTPRKVLVRSENGERHYVYADPAICKCLYVGGEEQYQLLRRQEQMAVDKLLAGDGSEDTMGWGLWGMGPRP